MPHILVFLRKPGSVFVSRAAATPTLRAIPAGPAGRRATPPGASRRGGGGRRGAGPGRRAAGRLPPAWACRRRRRWRSRWSARCRAASRAPRRIAERDRDAAGAGARGAADAVHVALGLVRQVEVDHVRDAVDVDAAGGDVGGHQHAGAPARKPAQRALPRALRSCCRGWRSAPMPARCQLLGHAVGAVLGAGEHEHPVDVADRPSSSRQQRRACSGLSHEVDRLVDALGGGRGAGVDRDAHRVAQQLVGQLRDLRRHGGGEQQRLPRRAAARRRSRRTSRMKPMSSMRSASSSTKISTLAQVHARRWPIRSSRRPGVADQDVDAAGAARCTWATGRRRRR